MTSRLPQTKGPRHLLMCVLCACVYMEKSFLCLLKKWLENDFQCAYGEALFLALQTSLIAFYVLYYQRKRNQALIYVTAYGGIFALLLSPIVPFKVLSILQMSIIPVISVSKLIQAYDNFKTKSTGQLSAVTVFLLFAGALARIFTSIQETGDQLLVLTFIVSAFFNGLIAFQMLFYWKSPAHAGKRSGKRKNKKS